MNTVGEPCAGKPHARFDEGWLARHLAGPAAYSTNTRSAPGQLWQVTSGVPSLTVPMFTWDYFTPFIDPRIVDRSTVDGVPTTVVSFFGGSNETAIWFRLWIDDSGLVRRAQMDAPGHYMQDMYSAFDAAPAMVPPSGTLIH